jgi:predicted acylesterase/phospholipase RssA
MGDFGNQFMTATEGGTHALVLSGGAAYAAYEVGVIKALLLGDSPATGYTPMRPSILTGTSAGAFNAAVLLSGGSDLSSAVGMLEEVWTMRMGRTSDECADTVLRFRLSPLNFLPACLTPNPLRPFLEAAADAAFFARDWFSRGVAFLGSSEDVNQRLFELVDVGTLVSGQPLNRLILSVLSLEEIRRSSVQLRIAATNWRTGAVRLFDNTQMTPEIGHLAVQAAISVPGLLHAVPIEGEPYCDAAIVMNTPLKPAIDAGADTIHVTYLDPQVQSIPFSSMPNTSGEIYRALLIGFAFALDRDIDIAQRINLGTSLIEKGAFSASPSPDELKGFFLVAQHVQETKAAYRQITIHRYQPQQDLGGIFRWFNFDRSFIADLIERGFTDAVQHDCKKNGCVLPN